LHAFMAWAGATLPPPSPL